jgi:hypothetical protein
MEARHMLIWGTGMETPLPAYSHTPASREPTRLGRTHCRRRRHGVWVRSEQVCFPRIRLAFSR